jgi:hypothetical protein
MWSDSLVAIVMTAACLLVMLLFYFIWKKQYKEMKTIYPFFYWSYIVMWVIWIVVAIVVLVKAEYPDFDGWRWALCIGTALASAWYGGWTSQYKMDKSEGIAPKN